MPIENPDLGPIAWNAGAGALAAASAAALKPMPRREVIGYLLSGIVLAASVPQLLEYYAGTPKVASTFAGVVCGLCGGFLVPKIQRFVDRSVDKKIEDIGGKQS